MPRVTKAQLEAQLDELEADYVGLEHSHDKLFQQNQDLLKENKKLKDQVRRGNSPSRSALVTRGMALRL
jgi:regulator of replication initiation timing